MKKVRTLVSILILGSIITVLSPVVANGSTNTCVYHGHTSHHCKN